MRYMISFRMVFLTNQLLLLNFNVWQCNSYWFHPYILNIIIICCVQCIHSYQKHGLRHKDHDFITTRSEVMGV